jgi:hypothetical protein
MRFRRIHLDRHKETGDFPRNCRVFLGISARFAQRATISRTILAE